MKKKLATRQQKIAQQKKQFKHLPKNLTIVELAARLGLSLGGTWYLAKKMNYKIKLRQRGNPMGSMKVSEKDWKKVDWQLPNIRIAEKLGVTRERVRQVRLAIIGVPVELKGFKFRAADLRAHRRKLGLTTEEYARLAGVSPISIYHWEFGDNEPRMAQKAKLKAIWKMSKGEAFQKLGKVEVSIPGSTHWPGAGANVPR